MTVVLTFKLAENKEKKKRVLLLLSSNKTKTSQLISKTFDCKYTGLVKQILKRLGCGRVPCGVGSAKHCIETFFCLHAHKKRKQSSVHKVPRHPKRYDCFH